MRKIFISIIFLICLPLVLCGQMQIRTRRVILEDFTRKTLKVVQCGNEMLTESLKNEVSKRWILSPFEFCSQEEFERLRTNENFYFLIISEKFIKKSKILQNLSLTVLKGTPEAGNISSMFEVVSIPFATPANKDGRELIFVSAFLDLIQDYITDAIEGKVSGSKNLSYLTMPKSILEKKKIAIYKSDLSPDLSKSEIDLYADDDMLFLEADNANTMFIHEAYNTVMSYVIAPSDSTQGKCYKMLIGADDHALYYFDSHNISEKQHAGFTKKDFKKIAGSR